MTFSGPVQTEWLDDGRDMRLLRELRYTDPNGTEWIAPAGAIVNGASIPRFLWAIVGSPFVGRYRAASVLHDHYCTSRTRPSVEVHRMFFHAMLDSGADDALAFTMARAVRDFGPRWDADGHDIPTQAWGDDPYADLRP